MPEKINHPAAQHHAQLIRFYYVAAIDALERLEKELKIVERGEEYVGVIPAEILAGYLYDTREMPLSVHPLAPALLEQAGHDVGRLLADVTDNVVAPEQAA